MSNQITKNLATLIAAIEEQMKAKVKTYAAIVQMFTPGMTVRWMHGDTTREAEVIHLHDHDPRLYVRSKTGVEYWIDVHKVIDRMRRIRP